MNGDVRRTREMVASAVDFSDARPDTDAGQAVSVGRLKEVKARMEVLAATQRAGVVDKHAGAQDKRTIRREMLAGPIAHLAEVGKLASREQRELATVFRLKPGTTTYLATLTAARAMLAAAETHRAVLTKYGLSESEVEVLRQLLSQFDTAIKRTTDGRAAHMGATLELKTLAVEAGQIVRAMDARNRHRFIGDGESLGAWISASTLVARKRGGSGAAAELAPSGAEGGTPVAGGEVRPAA